MEIEFGGWTDCVYLGTPTRWRLQNRTRNTVLEQSAASQAADLRRHHDPGRPTLTISAVAVLGYPDGRLRFPHDRHKQPVDPWCRPLPNSSNAKQLHRFVETCRRSEVSEGKPT